jgi:hypothetical protein
MRTVDTKAQKTEGGSVPLVEGSMKAKAEKESVGGSMRLVDGSMRSKAGMYNTDYLQLEFIDAIKLTLLCFSPTRCRKNSSRWWINANCGC